MNQGLARVCKAGRLGLPMLLVAAVAISWSEVAAAQSAQGQPRENNFEVTPFAGYMGGGRFKDPGNDSDRDIESDVNYGVFLGMNADGPDRQYELLYARQGTSIEGATPIDMTVQYLQIGGSVSFTDVQPVVPFFGVTVGATQFSPDGGLDDETRFSFTVGGGVKVPITEHIGLRFDARAFVTVMNSDSAFFCRSVSGDAACRIKVDSSTLVQYSAMLGVIAAF